VLFDPLVANGEDGVATSEQAIDLHVLDPGAQPLFEKRPIERFQPLDHGAREALEVVGRLKGILDAEGT
jgi:hypothetical protein